MSHTSSIRGIEARADMHWHMGTVTLIQSVKLVKN
jgi:hypothetical protein